MASKKVKTNKKCSRCSNEVVKKWIDNIEAGWDFIFECSNGCGEYTQITHLEDINAKSR